MAASRTERTKDKLFKFSSVVYPCEFIWARTQPESRLVVLAIPLNIGNRFEQVSDFLSVGYRTGRREVIENRRRYEAHVNAVESAGDPPFTSLAFAEPWPPGWNGYTEALSAMLCLDGWRPVQSLGSTVSESVQRV